MLRFFGGFKFLKFFNKPRYLGNFGSVLALFFWFSKHIYENQLDMLQQQLTREPYESPRLEIAARVPEYAKTGVYAPEWLEQVEPSDFSLVGYRHHEPLTAPMAV